MTERPTDAQIEELRALGPCYASHEALLSALETERERADGEHQERSIAADWASHHAARADVAEARIAAARALHKPEGTQWVAGKAVATCYVCGDFWPCATIQALDGAS